MLYRNCVLQKLCSAGNSVIQKLCSAGNDVVQKLCSTETVFCRKQCYTETVFCRKLFCRKLFSTETVFCRKLFYRNCVLQETVCRLNYICFTFMAKIGCPTKSFDYEKQSQNHCYTNCSVSISASNERGTKWFFEMVPKM